MDLVNFMYRYINRFINGNQLLTELKKIDLNSYSEEEQKEIKQLISDVSSIIESIPNEIDAIEEKRILHKESIINKLKTVAETDANKEEADFFKGVYANLIKEREFEPDGGKRYEDLFNLMTNNDLVNKYASAMNNEDLFKFITKYISVPLPPEIDQSAFNELVNVGIENDDREGLWRLAFNYFNKQKNFTKIIDYFIEKKDAYYLIELISAVDEDLNINEIINKVVATKDKNFVENCASRALSIKIIDEKKLAEMKEKMN